jgi:hypothetical protein
MVTIFHSVPRTWDGITRYWYGSCMHMLDWMTKQILSYNQLVHYIMSQIPLHLQHSHQLRNELLFRKLLLFFIKHFSESIKYSITSWEIFKFFDNFLIEFSRISSCSLYNYWFVDVEHMLEEKIYIINIPIRISLCNGYKLIGKYGRPVLDSYCGTIKIHEFIEICFPYFPTDIYFYVDGSFSKWKYQFLSFLYTSVLFQYLDYSRIDISILKEIEVEICGKPLQSIEKITGCPSLKSEILPDCRGKNIFDNLKQNLSMFFLIEHFV